MARLFVLTAGQAAAWRTLPLYLAVGIVSLVLFGGNGMDAETVTREAEQHLGSRLALLASWALATLPTARVWLGTPETFFVRALPVSRHTVVLVLGLGCVVVHAPWAVLWLRGAGPGSALWAVATCAAIQASALAGWRRWSDLLVFVVALGAACIGPRPTSALIATALFAHTLQLVWSRGVERAADGRGWVSSQGPLRAQLTALGVAVCRGHSSVLFRAALLGIGAAWLALAGIWRGAADELGITSLCLLFWAPAATFGAAALAGPVLRAEHKLDWIARACGAPSRVYVAPALLLASFGVLAGGAFALIVAASAGLGLARGAGLAAACATAGAATASIACSLGRRALIGDGRDAGRMVVANLGCISAWVVAITTLGARALPLMASISLGVLAWERSVLQRQVRRTCSS